MVQLVIKYETQFRENNLYNEIAQLLIKYETYLREKNLHQTFIKSRKQPTHY